MASGRAKEFVTATNKLLIDLSDKITPNSQYVKEGNKIASQVFEILKRQSKFGIDRVVIAGSIGKKTSIMLSDFDLVVFVNEEEPLFKEVLEDFKLILEVENLSLLFGPSDGEGDAAKTLPKLSGFQLFEIEKETRFSLQFRANGFSVDLLPASNFLHLSTKKVHSEQEVAVEQAKITLEKIKEDSDPNVASHKYGSCLTEATLEFMRLQSSFIHQLVRLSKFWNQSVYVGSYISGRSTIIELVAVFAGQQEEKDAKGHDKEVSILKAFKGFLTYMANLDKIEIKFPKFAKLTVYEQYLQEIPLVLDNVNPFNNYSKNLRPIIMAKFKAAANETLNRISLIEKKMPGAISSVRLDCLFSIQPRTFGDIFGNNAPVLQMKLHHLRVVAEAQTSVTPSIEYKGILQRETREKKLIVKEIQRILLVTISAYAANKIVTNAEIQKRAQKALQDFFRDQVLNFKDESEKYDVQLTLPFWLNKNSQLKMQLYVALNWSEE